MKRILNLFVLVLMPALSWSAIIGSRCPKLQIEKVFDDGTFLLERIDNKMTVCRQPDKRDSLMLAIGLFTRDSLCDRVAGFRYFKYNDSKYSPKEIKEAFYTELNKCYTRTDGLQECFSSSDENAYFSITDSKNRFDWIEYRPAFKIDICNANVDLNYLSLSKIARRLSAQIADSSVKARSMYLEALLLERMDSVTAGKEIPSTINAGNGKYFRIKTEVNNTASIMLCELAENTYGNCNTVNILLTSFDKSKIFNLNSYCIDDSNRPASPMTKDHKKKSQKKQRE